MPRYFLTTASPRLQVKDDEGIDIADDKALNRLVCMALSEMFVAEADDDQRQSFSVCASDADGKEVLSATLRLTLRRHQDP